MTWESLIRYHAVITWSSPNIRPPKVHAEKANIFMPLMSELPNVKANLRRSYSFQIERNPNSISTIARHPHTDELFKIWNNYKFPIDLISDEILFVVPNRSNKFNYNRNLAWLNKIQKRHYLSACISSYSL